MLSNAIEMQFKHYQTLSNAIVPNSETKITESSAVKRYRTLLNAIKLYQILSNAVECYRILLNTIYNPIERFRTLLETLNAVEYY